MLRKLSVLLMSVVLLMSALSVCAVAEGELEVSGVSVDTSSSTWTVSWSSEDESVYLLSVQLSNANGGSTTLAVLSNGPGYAEVDGSAAPFGTSDIDLAFGSEMSPQTLVVSGGTYTQSGEVQMYVALDVTEELLSVAVTDEEGNPVAGAPISVDIGNTVGAMTATTDDYGNASFSIVGMQGGFTWTVYAIQFESNDGITYLSASASTRVGSEDDDMSEPEVSEPEETQAPEVSEPEESEPEESEPEESEPEETEPRQTSPQLPTLPQGDTSSVLDLPDYEAVRGATTTAVNGDEIACNLSVDKSLLSQMKLKIGSFNKHGKLLVSKDDYTTLADLYGGTMVGSLTASPYKAVTTKQIEDAKKSESFFSESSADRALAVTFGLSLDFLQEDGTELHVTDLSDTGKELMFDVHIPVPGNMKKCKSFGVAMTGDNTLTPLTKINAEDGVLSFRTAALGYYTIVGFTDGKSATTIGGGSPLNALFIGMIVAGSVMLLLCILLTDVFFFRPKRRKKKQNNEPFDVTDDNDEFYAHPENVTYRAEKTPSDEQERADAEAFMREVLGIGVQDDGPRDIFSSAEREQEVLDPIQSARDEVNRGGDDIFGLYSRRIDE